MAFTGGFSPSPARFGSGDLASKANLLERVFQSIAAGRGSAYDQTTASIVGTENMALARAIVYDAWGANQRLANGFIPATMTAGSGMLQRWEKIYAVPPNPGDPEPVRRARVAAAAAKIGIANSLQPMVDALTAALGPVYVGVVHQTYQTSASYINGIGRITAAGTTPPTVTFTGTPTSAGQLLIAVTTGGALGTARFKWSNNNGLSYQATGVLTAAGVVLGTTGITANFASGTYATNNIYTGMVLPLTPWLSTLAHVLVQVSYATAGYHNVDGSPNGLFYQTVASVNTILDEMLPAWTTFDFFVNSSLGTASFRLDDAHNLDLEVLGS
jgi:hypothetical protein